LESHEATLDRLLKNADLAEPDMYRTREDLLSQALARQEERIAYVDEGMTGMKLREGPP
jgi:hypothetical protein